MWEKLMQEMDMSVSVWGSDSGSTDVGASMGMPLVASVSSQAVAWLQQMRDWTFLTKAFEPLDQRFRPLIPCQNGMALGQTIGQEITLTIVWERHAAGGRTVATCAGA